MDHSTHNKIVGFIWSVADDLLRDFYQRGKYRDVILPFTVLRRLDGLLEPTKEKVLETKKFLDDKKITNQQLPLQKASGYVFFNTSNFTFKTLGTSKKINLPTNRFNGYIPFW